MGGTNNKFSLITELLVTVFTNVCPFIFEVTVINLLFGAGSTKQEGSESVRGKHNF